MTNKAVESGNTVTLHYKGTFTDGTEFDNSYERGEPMTATVGSGQLIPGFDDALGGMAEGETKTFTLSAGNAYGERDPDATTTLERSLFPEDFEFTEGLPIPLSDQDGKTYMATISEIKDTTVVADFNHPMAGKDLTFEVELLSIDGDKA
jgi:peptidylprolyl isomerase